MSVGRHGQVAERTDGVVRVTVRPEVRVLTAEDMAMYVGYALDITDGYNDDQSKEYAIEKIWDWEHGTYPLKLTQKLILNWCGRPEYISAYEHGQMPLFDEDVESHQVLLELIHDRFPKFRKIEKEIATLASQEEE